MPALKVVYCLTSSGGDRYEAMTRVSLASVRLTNPTARIEIACDQQTHQVLRTTGSQLLREADAVHGIPTPDGPPTFRNRFVKTQLRLLRSGPFLFLDSDTVVRKSLSPLLDLQTDIAAAPNHSADTFAEQIWSEDQANLDTMGWQVREPYVNGGVIWYADTPAAHRFAETWHRNWLANVERTGRLRDQPALNFSLTSIADLRLALLNHQWNAQYACRTAIARNAIIWHSHASHADRPSDLFSISHQKLKGKEFLKPGSTLITRLVAANSPWTTRNKTKPQSLARANRRNIRATDAWHSIFRRLKYRLTASRAQRQQSNQSASIRVLAIGHEASLTGAPMLLLSYLRELDTKKRGIEYCTLLGRGGRLLKDYQRLGHIFVDGPKEITSKLSIYYLNTAVRLLIGIDVLGLGLRWWLCKYSRPDVIYASTVASIPTLNRALKRLPSKPPVVIHVHELDFILKQCNVDGSTGASLRQATKIISPSHGVANAVQRLFEVSAEKIEIVNEWVFKDNKDKVFDHTQKNFARRSLGLSDSDVLCIGVGRMQWRKGSDLLALLSKYCMDHSRSIHIAWVGLGDWEQIEQLKLEAAKLGSANNLHLLGEQVDPYAYLTAADIFILPSREDPYPVAMLEAASCKLPIVCFDQSGGGSEFIKTGAGISVPHMNIMAFASAVYKLSCQPSLRKEMGKKGSDMIQKNHLTCHAEAKITNILRKAARNPEGVI